MDYPESLCSTRLLGILDIQQEHCGEALGMVVEETFLLQQRE